MKDIHARARLSVRIILGGAVAATLAFAGPGFAQNDPRDARDPRDQREQRDVRDARDQYDQRGDQRDQRGDVRDQRGRCDTCGTVVTTNRRDQKVPDCAPRAEMGARTKKCLTGIDILVGS